MKISTDNLQNRPLVDFRWGFWVEFCLIFCKMVVKIGRREYTQRWVDIALGMRELVRTGMWWWELGGWERGRWSEGSSDQHRCRNVRCPAATARIGCGELARVGSPRRPTVASTLWETGFLGGLYVSVGCSDSR